MANEVDVSGDVAARAGQSVDDRWLSQAVGETMAAIRALAPCRVEEWLEPADLPADAYRVLIAVLARKLANPLEARHQTIGEFSVTMDAGTASGGFTDMELLIIRRVSGCDGEGSGRRAYTVSMSTSPPLQPSRIDRLI